MGKKFIKGLVTLGFLGFFVYQQFFQFGSKLEFGAGQEVYYTSGATETDARRVGEALQSVGYFGQTDKASVQVVKEKDDYVIRFVVNEKAYTDPSFKEPFSYLGYMVQERAFPNNKVHIDLCDSSLDTQLRLEPVEPPLEESAEEVETEEDYAADEEAEAEE